MAREENKKEAFRIIAKMVLRRHGLSDNFKLDWTYDYTYFAIGTGCPTGINFEDPKEQFVYELNGGNKMFIPQMISEFEDVYRNKFTTNWPGPL